MQDTDTTHAVPEESQERRRPGRPRSARAGSAILKATIEMLVEVGYGGMSVEAVATRAQVGKATVYRRWSSKKALVAEALRQLSDDVRTPDTGDTREDLIALLHDFRRVNSAAYIGPMTGRIISAAISNPEFMEIYWENALLPRRMAVKEILVRGQQRGDLRDDLDLDLVLDMLPGTSVYRILVSRHGLKDARPLVPEDIVNTLWAGIASGASVPPRKPQRC